MKVASTQWSWQGVLRIALTCSILLATSGAALLLKPTFDAVAVHPNVETLEVVLRGPSAKITQIDYTPDDEGGTRLSIEASGSSMLRVTAFGPTSGAPASPAGRARAADQPPACHAIVGTCTQSTHRSGNEWPYILGARYESIGVPSAGLPDTLQVMFDIPPWRDTGYVVSRTPGYVAVGLPAVVALGGDLSVADSYMTTAQAPNSDTLTTVNWSAGPTGSISTPGQFIWFLPTQNGSTDGLYTTGAVPDELSRNEWNTFLSGILLGVAAAAALALVGEIRRTATQESDATPVGESQSLQPPVTAAKPHTRIRSHRAAMLHRSR